MEHFSLFYPVKNRNIASGSEFDKRNEDVRYSINIDDDPDAVFYGYDENESRDGGEDVLKQGEEARVFDSFYYTYIPESL